MAEGQDKGNNKREFEDNNSDSDSDSEVYSPTVSHARYWFPLLFFDARCMSLLFATRATGSPLL